MRNIRKIVLLCLICQQSFAAQDDGYGVGEVAINLARITGKNILTHLAYAIKVVENDIYPNLSTYGKNVKTASTSIYAYLINTSGNTSTFSNWITTVTSTNSGSYIKNPYIAKLAIVDYGLKIEMQFAGTNITSFGVGTSAQVPVFEPFLARRIMLVPIFNATYSGTKVTSQDKAISSWTCLTDADETIASSANGISEGSLSVLSVAGGVLGSCQYISAATMNTIWITI
ncbi:hypothetical protein phytr_6400 [Candidatus Phycorickettsia trachydisci]|uniref:Uncharacterized protein n=1 Tax=Candidatus Phycorickettsia trachydisci TaxID=2115978 RepID=A0A2P1P8J4_9RICK|nr:hypothetical protein [Candidatus Phycorickettsia trachydisci]AVP87581.1 hypothetical protein phytr_6400 [Candidatus Phycorickettsia trachydisci]